MPAIAVPIKIGNPTDGAPASVTAMVDTGADHSVLPASLLKRLDVAPLERMQFMRDDGSRAEYDIGIARIALDGRERPCPVVFGPDDACMLGASTLEIFNLRADWINGCLASEEWLSLGHGGGARGAGTAPPAPLSVSAGDGYSVLLSYADGASGVVDLSHLAGQGIFTAWNDRAFLNQCGCPKSAASHGETTLTFAPIISICGLRARLPMQR